MALLALLALLAGCGQPGELPPAGAEGGELRIWRPGADGPTRIAAQRVRQEGSDPRRLALSGVRASIPLGDGRSHLAASAGTYDALGPVLLQLDGPVALHGWGTGGPFTGTAATAAVHAPGRDLVLEGVRLVHAGQVQRIERLVLPASWSQRRVAGTGEGLVSRPAPALAVAALGALPQAP